MVSEIIRSFAARGGRLRWDRGSQVAVCDLAPHSPIPDAALWPRLLEVLKEGFEVEMRTSSGDLAAVDWRKVAR